MDSSFTLIAASFLLVLLSVILKSRRRPVVLLDPGWAIIIGYFINYCVKPVLFVLSPQASTMYMDLGDASAMSSNVSGPLVMGIVFFASFMMSNIFGKHAKPGAEPRRQDNLAYVMASRRFLFITALMICGGLVSLYFFLRELNWSGTLEQLLTGDARGLMLSHNVGKGYYIIAMHLSQFAWCMYALTLANRRNPFRGIPSFLASAVLFVIALLVPLILGQRFGMIVVITGALIAVNKRILTGGQQTTKLRYIVIAVVAIFLISGPIGVVLKGMPVTLSNVVLISTSAWDSFELHSQMVPDDDQHFLYGVSYLEDFVYSYLPRLWFEKPERYGIRKVQDMVAPSLERLYGTFPPGIVLEAYFNFGWPGLVAIPSLLGLLSIALTKRLARGDTYWTLQAIFVFLGLVSFRGVGNVFSEVCFQYLVIETIVRVGLVFDGRSLIANSQPMRDGTFSQPTSYPKPAR